MDSEVEILLIIQPFCDKLRRFVWHLCCVEATRQTVVYTSECTNVMSVATRCWSEKIKYQQRLSGLSGHVS